MLFLLNLTTIQKSSLHHHCNSDVYSSASGMADLQQLTTLQYCLIDNCTIIRNDTRQQLDIVYTTQSHLVVTPTDGQTSTMLISKNIPELFCSTTNTTDGSAITQAVGMIKVAFIALVSSYIVVVHIIFKEIRGTFGKLLMFSSIALVCGCINIITLSITHFNITINSTFPCYLFNFLFMQLLIIREAFATSYLAYLALLMRYTYKSIEMSKTINKRLYKFGVMYALGSSLVFGFFVVMYDLGTGTYRHTLLPNGHCSFFATQLEYDTVTLVYAITYVIKIVQVVILVAYFIYYYKVNKVLKNVRKMANNDRKHNNFYFKIALTMGATIGISQILLPISWYFQTRIGIQIVGILFFTQQCVIMSLYVCSKKMRRLLETETV